MKHFSRAALMAGAMAIPQTIERKDTAALPTEVREAVDKLVKNFEEFKTKNDQLIEQKTKDAVTKDELEKVNKGFEDLKAEVKTQVDEIFKKANRLALEGGGDAAETKAAKAFGELIGKADFTPENLREYKQELAHFIRRNEVKATTLMVGSDPAGGYLVAPDTNGRLVQKVYETTPMRQVANVVSIGTDSLEGPIDNGEGEALWRGEAGAVSATGSPELGMWKIEVHELYAYPIVTQKLLEDAKIDVEAWIGNKAAAKFGRKENTSFVNGTGTLQPRGLWTYDKVATADATRAWNTHQFMTSGHATLINSADPLIDLIFELNAAYRQRAKWMLAKRTQGSVRKLKDGDGNYLSGLKLDDGVLSETLLGFGTVEGEDCPAIAAGAYPIAFGDFDEGYTIVDRLGISVVRDNITRPGFVKFLMRKRVGGGAVNFEAVKFLKVSV